MSWATPQADDECQPLRCRYIPGAAAGCDWIMAGCWDVLVGMIVQVKRVLAGSFVSQRREFEALEKRYVYWP